MNEVAELQPKSATTPEIPVEGQVPDARSNTMHTVNEIVQRSSGLIDELRESFLLPQGEKVLNRRYTITEAAKMLDKSTNGIRKAEELGALPEPDKHDGRRIGYTLAQLNQMRDYFGIRVGRKDGEKPIRLSFQNFKGGVGKTTLCCHAAQYFAQCGYRVLLIDCDSQASTTTTFGFRPDIDFGLDDTLAPWLGATDESPDSLQDIIIPTHWDRLHLIPANLELYSAEYSLAGMAGTVGSDWISLLHDGISSVENAYDVIIIDPPPALGMISLNVLRSLNGLIVPTPPAMYDFHSTATFFRMLEEVLGSVGRHLGSDMELDFLKLLVSKYDTSKDSQKFVVKLMSDSFREHVIRSPMVQSATIDNASGEWNTVYEVDKSMTSTRTYKRCVDSLDAVFGEVELLLRSCWPSHHDQLISKGLMAL